MTRRSRRNAVLAPLTRWLWWSPWRLLSTTIVAIICLAVVLAVLRSAQRPRQRSASVPARPSSADLHSAAPAVALATDSASGLVALVKTPASTGAEPLPTSVTATIALPAAANDRRQALAAATAWTRLWARPSVPAGQWLASLTPGTFHDYLPTLAAVEPANVPADAVAGTASVQVFGTGSARVAVPVHNKTGTAKAMHTVVLQLIWYPTSTAGHWVVSGVDGH